jgi:hypothetical protein
LVSPPPDILEESTKGPFITVRKHDHREIKQNKCINKKQKIQNIIETHIYVVDPMWAMSTREIVRSFFFIIQQMKGYNLQHIHCNFLFFLSQYPLSEIQ